MPISIRSGSAILHTWTGWEFRLWNNFGMAFDSEAKLFIHNADKQEFWNFLCQTFYHFSKLISLFSRLCSGLENCFANFKTFSRIQDSAQTLCEAFFFNMSFCFALKYFISLWVFVFVLRFVVLPWGFWFCHEVFAFAVKRGICYCCDSCGLL